VDFRRFKTGDWWLLGGGVVVFVAGFLDWFTLDGVSGGVSAFDFTLTGLIPWLLIVAAAVVGFLRAGGVIKESGIPWTPVVFGASALGLLLILIRLLIGSDLSDHLSGVPSDQDVSLDRAFGLWLAVAGAIAANFGAFLDVKAGGGDVRDPADVQKMRDAFNDS
jgi:hypothetical protein